MVTSMTGFGKAIGTNETKKVIVECKSLNSKGLDFNCRLPQVFREMEGELRTYVSQTLERGKVDLSINIENLTEDTSAKINTPILKSYMNQLQEVLPDAPTLDLMKMAINMPDVLKTDKEELDKDEWQFVFAVVKEAIENLTNFRKSDGLALTNEFETRIANIENLLTDVAPIEAERKDTVRQKLQLAINELAIQVDENRFEQELIYYLEKYDVTEEKVRLKSHLSYFLDTLKSTHENNGRKLGFITQEMGREINTLGSKANHAAMQKLVVLMKDELEKIKEQVLNVL